MWRALRVVALAVVYAVTIALFLRKDASSWTFPDWLAVVGFPLTWLGLLLAWLHLGEIKQAANDSREASQNAETASQNALDASKAAKEGSEASREASTAAKEGANAALEAAEQARDAAAAARDSIKRTEAKLSEQNLLMLMGEVAVVLGELERAKTNDDFDKVAAKWIDVGGQMDGLLKTDGGHAEMARLLGPSVDGAGALKNAIYENGNVEMAAKELRTQLTGVRVAASNIMGRMRAFTREERLG